MNHLAHFHLAGESAPLLVGALLGDYLKGPLTGCYEVDVELGVRLHRRIDAFTDGHALLRELRTRFPGAGRRLSGIVLDLYFDLLLVRHWERFHHAPLRCFSAQVHVALIAAREILPASAQRQVERMIEHDLLVRYGEPAVVQGTLLRLGERLRLPEAMSAAISRAEQLLAEIEQVFLQLYPQAIEEAAALRLSAGRYTR